MSSKAAIQVTPQDTPMLKQFKEVKAQHLDAILFFRLGDFYEMFLEDAVTASKELDLTLTGRGKDDARIPMCGIPHHAAENYIQKLVNRGYKVAICEQVEDPTEAKGITKRDVVKIVTPGTIQGAGALDEKTNNFLSALTQLDDQKFGVSILDLSTGEFRVTYCHSEDAVSALFERLEIKECIFPRATEFTFLSESLLVNKREFVSINDAAHKLKTFYNLSQLDSLGLTPFQQAFPAAAALIDYVSETQKRESRHIQPLKPMAQNRVTLDYKTITHLELIKPSSSHQQSKSLFSILDFTKTPMGGRLLKRLIKEPFNSQKSIEQRQDALEAFLGDILSREEIRAILGLCGDLERLLSRILSGYNNPRDMAALGQGLSHLPDLVDICDHFEDPYLTLLNKKLKKLCDEHQILTISQTIQRAIKENPPNHIREGHIFNEGYSDDLDQLTDSFSAVKTWVTQLEELEREATGIKSLKVGYNKVFGYYLEVPKSQQQNVPETYIRKQTLTNAERYITPELKEKETILLNGEEEQARLEAKLYEELIQFIHYNTQPLQETFQILADLDTLQSLASAAQKHNYTKPGFAPENLQLIDLKNARHPILELQKGLEFIPNDVYMDSKSRLHLITGPNMAGKSTVMRQTALLLIMAQIGSYVPASSATLSLVDTVYTRIGASDDLFSGQSTFMVEMVETAAILNRATPQSFIVLDEVGRGTATYDGISIAWALTEYIHNQNQSRTFFATHYHELTVLEKHLSSCRNFSMQIHESENTLTFTYKLVEGPADKSYGIHVAQLAGLPEALIAKAEQILSRFESSNTKSSSKKVLEDQLGLF